MYFRKKLHHNEKGEVNTSPSCTIPNDSMSIHEIFRRYAQGTLPRVSKQPQYLNDEDVETLLMEDSPYDGQSRDLSDLDLNQGHINNLLESAVSQANLAKEKGKEKIPAVPPKPDVGNEPTERSEPIP